MKSRRTVFFSIIGIFAMLVLTPCLIAYAEALEQTSDDSFLNESANGHGLWAERIPPSEMPLGDTGRPDDYEQTVKDFRCSVDRYDAYAEQLSQAFDWRDQGVVTPAKDQGMCGSCWAFASVGVLESKIRMAGGPLLDLSEQQQVSCNAFMEGCCGGNSKALKFWYDTKPVESDYDDYNTSCPITSDAVCTDADDGTNSFPYNTTDYYTVNADNINDVKMSLHEDGPAYFRYDVYFDFSMFWETGSPGDVYTQSYGDYQGGHAVMIIGWDDSKNAWLCRNSWGETGGPDSDGTFWIAYSGHARDLELGMANVKLASFPKSIRVPDDYPTIQSAIDAASDGDIVEVAPGTYTGEGNKNLDLGGKAITVRSESGADGCIIDCQGEGRGFYFHNGEGNNSVIDGFTIQNGSAYEGGGIYCLDSSPTVTNCTISDNSASFGGGIYCLDSSPIITYCMIRDNSAICGGGVFCFLSSPVLTNCALRDNSASTGGGGIYCVYESSLTLSECTIEGNSAIYGGGIFCTESSPILTRCTISNNSASSSSSLVSHGGGIYCVNGSSPSLDSCILSGNSAALGGGMFSRESSPNFTNCSIGGNSADSGGGICSKSDISLIFTNCIIAYNSANNGGGIYCFLSYPLLTNSILWGNMPE